MISNDSFSEWSSVLGDVLAGVADMDAVREAYTAMVLERRFGDN